MTPPRLVDVDDFRASARTGRRPEGALFKLATAEPQAVQGALRTMRFTFSDATIDHSGDSIDPKGWNLGIFKRNPVALFAHDSFAPPIGKAKNVHIANDKLIGDIEFASEEVYPFANTIFQLVKGGFLNAVSVGFKPDDWAFSPDKGRPNGINFKKQTLLEISVCPVPCNPNALSGARSFGIDTAPLMAWARGVVDSGQTGVLPRGQLEALRGQTGGPARRRTVRSTAPSDHPLLRTIDDVGGAIGITRQAIRDVQGALAPSAQPPLDELQLKLAISHFSAAIASKNLGLAFLRAALASASDNQEPNPPEPNPPVDLGSGAPRAHSLATPADRLRYAATLRRSLTFERRPETPPERRVEAANIARRLKASGMID